MTGEEVLGVPAPLPLEGGSVVPPPQEAVRAVADLSLAGLYVPAGPGPEPVAGDFFDVLQVDDDVIALLVGDVAGHGRQAVARMRQLRSATRAYALERRGPAALLARLDAFMERDEQEAYATLWYGEYRPSTGVLRYGSAGHPPPVLHVHPGVRLLAEADAPLLGTGVAHPAAAEHTEHLPPGAVLVAYSDGLVERRGTHFGEQLELLAALVQRACDPARAGTSQTIAAELLDALVPDHAAAEDDVCVLVVRRQPQEQGQPRP
jgi:serine phosphatase RsbU (regulator of sigma subunit)